jgi:hypothetical protein
MNLYQRISPRFIRHPKPAQLPKPKTHRLRSAVVYSLGGVCIPVAQGYIGKALHEVPFL